ncbi:hypothetical protein FSARC_10035 [Fusarium sarcochroum]|uniref:Uncharacterized protein n=1 Tax=Fusarium sarcochroum TaxID=1208366 RepID=A0A8H4X5L1_9HYPO|nr:hypothetical protein FSARC_10035 [Fusarium sarcochroum]
MHSSWFSYAISRPYPFRWFTPVTIVGGTILTVVFTIINLASSGFYLKPAFTEDPNSTTIQAARVTPSWWLSWITSFPTATASCTVMSNMGLMNLTLGVEYDGEGDHIYNYVIQDDYKTHASTWWGTRLLNAYFTGILTTMSQTQQLNDTAFIRDRPRAEFAPVATEGLHFARILHSLVAVDLGNRQSPNLLLKEYDLLYAILPSNDPNRESGGFLNGSDFDGQNARYSRIPAPGSPTPPRDKDLVLLNETYDRFTDQMGPLECNNATIVMQYLCSVPQSKSPGVMLLAIVLANLVFLQAAWKILNWVAEVNEKTPIPFDWHGGPHTLHPGRFELVAGWIWDIFLTLAPNCFFALAIASLRLDKKPISPYGEHVLNLTLISPTIFPIIFAAVVSRFFKNLARWRLEKRKGINLATLEQTFGSQNLAGAVERLLFVRTQVLIGIAIVLVWGLSPLGGQSAARLLNKAEARTLKTGTIYYEHPAYQRTWASGASGLQDSRGSINTLYTASLLSSPTQKSSPVDLWELPKIPQWPHGLDLDGKRIINQDTLVKEDEYYTSMLGVKVYGLNIVAGAARYDFTVQKSYFDIDCKSPKNDLFLNQSSQYLLNTTAQVFEDVSPIDGGYSSFASSIFLPTKEYADIANKSALLDDFPAATMYYATMQRNPGGGFGGLYSLFNCSMRAVIVETDILCNATSMTSTSCRATHQKRVTNHRTSSSDPILGSWYMASLHDIVTHEWREAEGKRDYDIMSSTDNYLAGEKYPFARQRSADWANVSVKDFSRRLTTAFNTYWEATLNPFNHTSVSFQNDPPAELLNFTFIRNTMNQTEAVAITRYDVYSVDRKWVTVLMITTVSLEILAVAGLVLQALIRGPDILGFASSLTRENTYMNLSSGGSALDGPARARALKNLRVHLADIYPGGDTGYIAFKTVHTDGQAAEYDEYGNWRELDTSRRYL